MLKTLSSSVYWMGPVYLVIFCYWVGPVPYLELFGAGPVEKNTLYDIYILYEIPQVGPFPSVSFQMSPKIA